MNYRHGFHAGNFADVCKHAVLARVIAHLREKPSAFRVIDTHAGPGLTKLTGPEATRTGEWREGIGRLVAASLRAEVQLLLAPYLDAVAAVNPPGRLVAYPGSALLAQAWLRRNDRLIACELEPSAASALIQCLKGDARTKAVVLDGFTALGAFVPPKERRGVVLIDPPFERPDEFGRLRAGLAMAHRKWPTGIYLVWYPIKDRRVSDAFARDVAHSGMAKILRAELTILPGSDANRLLGSGLLVVNPPWLLERELRLLIPALALALRRDPQGRAKIDWLTHEK
jgi:23S rRNA (adenine2030-N6)-methyltransferase